jgi:hypothetical protein
MRLASDWLEAAMLAIGVLGVFGLRLHWSCNLRRCWRHELAPTGYCRKHQRRRLDVLD